MSDFFKKFLAADPRKTGTGGRFVALAAFGKHPGWDDHVEDLGLETESLNLAKTVLYVNGIGGQIDAGAWEKLEPAQQLPAFKHLFVWQRTGQILVGRLWSSSDGKGRKRYPMVVCAHFGGVTLGWALKQALPALAELEQGCLNTSSAAEVRALLSRKRAVLRAAIESTDGRGEYAPVTPEGLHKILPPGDGAKLEGFLRVLYQIQSQMGAFAPGTVSTRTNPATLRPQQIRVPAAGENPEQVMLFWTRFFMTQVDSDAPLLLTLPLEADWLDVTVGEPESHEFFCLRASPKAVPLVSEVPYKMDDAFRAEATAFLDGFRRGETKVADLHLTTAVASTADAAAPAKGGWLKWLGIGVVVVVVGVAVTFMLTKDGAQPASRVSGSDGKSAPVKSATNTQPAMPATEPVDPAKEEAARAKARMDAETEAARLAEEKKNSEAMAAAAKLKADAEAAARERERELAEAAAKARERELAEAAARERERQLAEAAARERERQLAEAARLERERNEARERELAEEQRKQAEELAAKKKAEEQARAMELAAASTNTPDSRPADGAVPSAASATGEMTNSTGMVLVSLPSGIWVGKYEVTQAQYAKVMGNNPSRSVNDDQPVEQVTWNDAMEFVRRLNEMERGSLPAGKAYALPTEKQWIEFRADQKFEDLPVAPAGKTNPSVVGQSGPANKYGLFDVLGNVYEWCLDDATSGEKLLKGGAFNSRYDNRTLLPDQKAANCGFRCVLVAK